MDDKQREGLEVTLGHAFQERAQLDALIAYLQQKLGRQAPAGTVTVSVLDTPTPSASGADAASFVSEGEFFKMTSTKASMEVLRRLGKAHPQKADQLLAAIAKGGVKLGGGNPTQILYKSLHRNPAFQKVGSGRWGLAEWYGARAKKSRAQPTAGEAEDGAAGESDKE